MMPRTDRLRSTSDRTTLS